MVLKILYDEWEDGWVVEFVGAEAPDERVHSSDWFNAPKKHRKRTDVPKGTFKG